MRRRWKQSLSPGLERTARVNTFPDRENEDGELLVKVVVLIGVCNCDNGEDRDNDDDIKVGGDRSNTKETEDSKN